MASSSIDDVIFSNELSRINQHPELFQAGILHVEFLPNPEHQFIHAMSITTLLRKSRSFARRSWFEKAWFLPAWLLLGASRFLILFVPFRHMASRMGKHAGLNSWIPLVDARQNVRAMSIARVIALAARYTPWKSNCFPQAVTAKVLLGLYGIPNSLFLGVSRDSAAVKLKAHAWVAAGRVRVTGKYSFDQFTVVGCFVSP